MRRAIHKLLAKFGYAIVKPEFYPALWDMNAASDSEFQTHYARAAHATMTSKERMYALYQAVCYVTKNRIPGDVVECGVWHGGSSMLAASTLAARGETDRRVYLYDTFDGMSAPTERDRDGSGRSAAGALEVAGLEKFSEFCNGPRETVEVNMRSSGYPEGSIVYVQGKVEDTIPGTMPDRIAILRLDTDWFESTYHELTHLYPRLVPGGVLIIDDYGHWQGAREAVDRYFEEQRTPILLNRIDYTGRIAVKPGEISI